MASKFHENCVITGIAGSFCLLCQTYLGKDDLNVHIATYDHKDKLASSTYLDKYEDDRIWKVESGYYCETCNSLIETSWKLKYHINDSSHIDNKNYHLLKSVEEGVVVFDDTLIEKQAWNGVNIDTCYICNVEYVDENDHLNESSHILNLIQCKLELHRDKFIYRKVDNTFLNCLVCNSINTIETREAHIEDSHHVNNYVKCQEIMKNRSNRREQKESIKILNIPRSVENEASSEENVKTMKKEIKIETECQDNMINLKNQSEQNENTKLLNIPSPIEIKSTSDENVETMKKEKEMECEGHENMRTLKNQSEWNEDKKVSNIFSPIETKSTSEENVETMKVETNMETKYQKKTITLINLSEQNGNAKISNIPTPIKIKSISEENVQTLKKEIKTEIECQNIINVKSRSEPNENTRKSNVPTAIDGATPSSCVEEINNASKENHNVTLTPAAALKKILQFAKNNNLKYKRNNTYCKVCKVKVSSSFKKLQEHVAEQSHKDKEANVTKDVPVKVPMKVECEILKHLHNFIISNNKFHLTDNSYHTITEHGTKYRCQMCEVSINKGEIEIHKHMWKHAERLLLTALLEEFDTEVVREVRPGIYHCGLCNFIEGSLGGLKNHLASTSHKFRKMIDFIM